MSTHPRGGRASSQRAERKGGLIAEYKVVLGSPWARFITICVFVEAALLYAVLSFIGESTRSRAQSKKVGNIAEVVFSPA